MLDQSSLYIFTIIWKLKCNYLTFVAFTATNPFLYTSAYLRPGFSAMNESAMSLYEASVPPPTAGSSGATTPMYNYNFKCKQIM